MGLLRMAGDCVAACRISQRGAGIRTVRETRVGPGCNPFSATTTGPQPGQNRATTGPQRLRSLPTTFRKASAGLRLDIPAVLPD